MLASAGATGESENLTHMEQLERNKVHSTQFYEILEAERTEKELKNSNSTYKRLLTYNEYNQLILEIEEASRTKTTKTQRQYYILNAYEVFEVAGVKKIIAKRKKETDDVKYLVPYEDVFEAILSCHKVVGHKGRDIMARECSKAHMNLTGDLISCNFIILYYIYY